MRNPFQYGAELKPSQIVNRRQELRDVQRAILEHGRLFLLGPRRFGKTADSSNVALVSFSWGGISSLFAAARALSMPLTPNERIKR
jgi:hypothetical protein